MKLIDLLEEIGEEEFFNIAESLRNNYVKTPDYDPNNFIDYLKEGFRKRFPQYFTGGKNT